MSYRAVRVLLILALFALAGLPALAQIGGGGNPNLCDVEGEEPDIILGDIYGHNRYGEVDGITGFSFATESCNVGTCWAEWISGSPGNHPVIAQHMYRLKNGRFQQIGQSWVKHGFAALNGDLCETPENQCIDADGSHLGVNCSDPYSSTLNGQQSGLGPKSEVNASTGVHLHPYSFQGQTGDNIYKRLQVKNDDLDPALNPGATYILEGQYVAADDAAAGNNDNNSAYRTINVVGSSSFDIELTGSTVPEAEAMKYWEAMDPTIFLKTIEIPNDGYFMLGSQAYDLGGGFWRYEYALQNVTSDRAAAWFEVPFPATALILNAGFSDVDYHSLEPYDGTDWSITIGGGTIRWETVPHSTDPDANALRWGTTYNFWFDSDVAPVADTVELGLFKPGTPTSEITAAVQPDPNGSGGGVTAGEVYDGLLIGEAPFNRIALSWDPSCSASDTDYEIYEGVMGDYTSHIQKECSTSGATNMNIVPESGDRYYLIVPRTSAVEGTYGVASDGSPRPVSQDACLQQIAGACE